MTLRHLEIFIHVYENKSISKAALSLHISQPSVSMAIKELENEYTTQLFERMNKSMKPTTFADKLYQYATHIHTLIDEMNETMSSFEETSITIGCSFSISQFILPALIEQFKVHYPETTFHVRVDNYSEIEQMIMNNTVDFALLETDPQDKDIIKIPFYNDYLETFARSDHPLLSKKNVSILDLQDYDYYTREDGSSISTLVQSVFTAHQSQITPVIKSANPQALIEFVKHSHGISTLPSAFLKEGLNDHSITLLHVHELHLQRTYYIVYHKNKYLTDMYQQLFHICQKIN